MNETKPRQRRPGGGRKKFPAGVGRSEMIRARVEPDIKAWTADQPEKEGEYLRRLVIEDRTKRLIV